MKKILLLAASLLFVLDSLAASLPFQPNKKYRIACQYYGNGTFTLGSRHAQAPMIYYDTSGATPTDGWWLVEGNDTQGYAFKNAQTGQYLENCDTRIEVPGAQVGEAVKGLRLSPRKTNDCLWRIEGKGSLFAVVSRAQTDMSWNVRKDGTYLVGTYAYNAAGGAGDNSLFAFYDEQGIPIMEGNSLTVYLTGIKFGRQPLLYDKGNGQYLLPVSADYMGGHDFSTTVTFATPDGTTARKLHIDADSVASGEALTLHNVSGTRDYRLSVLSGTDTLASDVLRITFMPVVELTHEACSKDQYEPGTIRVNDPDNEEENPLLYAKFKYRGATASGLPKKSYAVKLTDEEGESLDYSFFGLRDDNNWILDAMGIDNARMRNRVSTDLWNDFSRRPYYFDEEEEANPGTRGRFVEVLLNGTYQGLYCLTEKMDRKQLKLKKLKEADEPGQPDVIRGVLYKTDQWSFETLMGHDQDQQPVRRLPMAFNNQLGIWGENSSVEMKYPDIEDGEIIDWGPLYNAVALVSSASDQQFEHDVETYFDLPVWTDYYLFIELMLATDNHGKNLFLLNYNTQDETNGKKMSLAPWDLDGAWGIRWDGSTYYTADATQDFDAYVWRHEHGQHTLYMRLRNAGLYQFDKMLTERYKALRKTYFNPDSLAARFAAYGRLFTLSGADQRERQRWSASGYQRQADIQNAVDYIQKWIDTRLQTLDAQYGYTENETPSGISPTESDAYWTAAGGRGCIWVKSAQPLTLNVYTVAGLRVKHINMRPGQQTISGLDAGVYLINGRKVLVQ